MSEPTLETNPYTAALETIDKKTSSITDTDTLITNESAITMNSNHSSLADHYSYDASSSHDSLSTIATFDDKKKDLSHHSRAVAQTNFQKGHSNNNHPETNRDVIEIYDQLEELESKNQSLEEQSDSEGYIYDEAMMPDKTHKRHLSRCSVISTRSYDSTASNYDMLLARLGSKDTLVSIPINSPSKEKDDDIDWEFWSKVISDYNSFTKSQKKTLSGHVQKGIPPSLRGMVWPLLTGSKNLNLEEQYLQLIDKESVYEKAIIRDISKSTLLDHEFFKGHDGQEVLFNIVKAYSLYDAEVGYHQALLYISAPLLLNLPEEEAFGVLVQLLNKYSLRGHFLHPSTLLSQRLYQLEGLVADNLPHVQRHLIANGVRSNMYAYEWFLSVFARSCPLDVVYRIYDLLFLDGVETIFQFAIALLDKNDVTILGLEYDDLINFLNDHLMDAYKTNTEQFVIDALRIQINTKRLDRLAKDFRVESTQTNTETKAISSLKLENKALSEAIAKMQKDFDTLNNDHTHVATELVSRKMEMVRVHEENEGLRQQSADLKKTLETLPVELEKRAKEEIKVLNSKNEALVEKNSALEDQLTYMEKMIIDIKKKYLESELEKEKLEQKLRDMKHLIVG